MRYLLAFIVIALFMSCGSTKKSAETINPTPEWITTRPVDPYYYSGIGIAKKWGTPDNYKSDARQKALSDMAGQISTNISSTSILYKVEDKTGVSEILSNNIKASSMEFLEGYEEMASYENETHYYVYFRLSKLRFAEIKATRKEVASNNAMIKYQEAELEKKNENTYSSIKLYINALEAMTNYLGEDNTKQSDGKTFDVCIESIKEIQLLVNNLNIDPQQKEITAKPGAMVDQSKLQFIVWDGKKRLQPNIPVKFKYSSGFLRKDSDLSTSEGLVMTTIHQIAANGQAQTLCADIDIISLIRSMTKDLLLRKLFEGTAGKSNCIQINLKE